MKGQAAALLWLRAVLAWRGLLQKGGAGGVVAAVLGALGLIGFAALLAFVPVGLGEALRRNPALLAARGGPVALFALGFGMILAARVWAALVRVGQSPGFLDPRRFRVYPVSPRLLSALNFAAVFFDPVWLAFYPALVSLAVMVARLSGAPPLSALLAGEALGVFAAGGLLHVAAALGGALDARPLLRRLIPAAIVLSVLAALAFADRSAGRMLRVFEPANVQRLFWTPPGWAARFAQLAGAGDLWHALGPAALLVALGAGASLIAHQLSLREAIRPADTQLAAPAAARAAGLRLPFVSDAFSALVEKELKTVVRVGYVQLLLMPVSFLLLRTIYAPTLAKHPLIFAAGYAHMGVLDLATNAFGRDLGAARAWFLWPVSRRSVIAAKNAVAYAFSLASFAALAGVDSALHGFDGGSLFIAFCAHAATFPVMITFGNLSSTLAPMPVRGARLRRVKGAGPLAARILPMLLIMLVAWAPFALHLPLAVAYAGELVTMAVVYAALLGVAARLLERRREPVLAALAGDEQVG